MSQKQPYHIRCPKCGHEQEVELFDSVNVSEEPSLREDLIAQRINLVQCGSCSFSCPVDKTLLYNDPDREIMVYWMPLVSEGVQEGEARFRDFMQALSGELPGDFEAPHIHLVFTRTELAERIFMLEDELDERIVEYMKYMVYTRNAGKIDPRAKGLLYNAQTSTDETISFLIQDLATHKIEGMLEYSREAYESLEDMFDQDEQTANLLEFFPGPYISARHLMIQELEREQNEASAT